MLKQSLLSTLVVTTLLAGCNKPANSNSTQNATQSAETATTADSTATAAADSATTNSATTDNAAKDTAAKDTAVTETAKTEVSADATPKSDSDTAQAADVAADTSSDTIVATPVLEKKPLPEHHPDSETTAAKAGITPEPVPDVAVDSTANVPTSEQY